MAIKIIESLGALNFITHTKSVQVGQCERILVCGCCRPEEVGGKWGQLLILTSLPSLISTWAERAGGSSGSGDTKYGNEQDLVSKGFPIFNSVKLLLILTGLG